MGGVWLELLREVEEGEGWVLVGQLALPLRSRKKTADAIVGGEWA